MVAGWWGSGLVVVVRLGGWAGRFSIFGVAGMASASGKIAVGCGSFEGTDLSPAQDHRMGTEVLDFRAFRFPNDDHGPLGTPIAVSAVHGRMITVSGRKCSEIEQFCPKTVITARQPRHRQDPFEGPGEPRVSQPPHQYFETRANACFVDHAIQPPTTDDKAGELWWPVV